MAMDGHTMETDAEAPRASTSRQHKPQDLGPLKAIAYEDAAERTPPLAVQSIFTSRPPSSPRAHKGKLKEFAASKRPRTSPNPRSDRSSHLSGEAKRDSGFAPSLSTAGRESYAESHQSGAGIAVAPSLPTIMVQNDESQEELVRSRSPLARFRTREKPPPRAPQAAAHSPPPLPPPPLARVRSFKGIQTSIPSMEDDFGELTTEKVKFSNRGSILFGGKRMAELLQAHPEEPGFDQMSVNGGNEPNEEMPQTKSEHQTEAQGRQEQLPTTAPHEAKDEGMGRQEQLPPIIPSEVKDEGAEMHEHKPRGLVTGRRQPSVHMLQAAIHGGRVLSAEEITFSLKVRSMYEHGDERAAEWVTRPSNGIPGRISPEPFARATTPDVSIDEVLVSKTRRPGDPDEHPAFRSVSPDMRKNHDRQPHEIAGGIEDWENVDGQDVDRYGFISAKRVPSGEGPQRVATALRFEASKPRGYRKLQRGPSNARSSRSLPPNSSRRNSKTNSLTSAQSHHSSAKRSFFRSKDQKITEEAGDMLHLPPGITEPVDQNSKIATTIRKRERTREEKWRGMARQRGNANRGDLIQFDFDASDPKVISRTWKGIPDRWRATAWHSFLTSSAKRRGKLVPDEELIATFAQLQEESCADDVQIDVDVPRTISMHIMFRRRYRGGQRLLFRVLHAISLHCPETGYVQGMASLAATLLCYYDEERAFVMMVRLWQLRGLEQLFQPGFEGLMAALNAFEKDWLGGGDVAQKLEELTVTSMTYGTRWYLTLFNLSIPFPAQLRVWDVFMLLGDVPLSGATGAFGGADLDVLHATSAALIDATREIVLDSDFENVMKVLTSFIPIKDEDMLMRVTRAEYKMRKKRLGMRV